MCLVLIAYHAHPDYALLVAANRDEFHDRPTAPLAFWDDSPQVLAGRDLKEGGAWMGFARPGRFAALTNYRDPGHVLLDAPSRGYLVRDYLQDVEPAHDYLDRLMPRATAYNGFNLLLGDETGLYYYSNRAGGVQALTPGVYGLSNHLLDTPWPKLASAKAAFAEALAGLPASSPFFELLADQEIVPDSHLPETGVPLAWERILSAVFVRSESYGTRASTLLTMRRDGQTSLLERSFDSDARLVGQVGETFQSSLISTGV